MIHLVSGKGGVGKSTLAAALAWRLAEQGRKTLLIEFGERGYFRHLFKSELGMQPVSLNSHLSLARWEGETCLRDYLRHLLKIDRVVKLFFDNKVMHALVQAAPALKELALLGKLTSGARHHGPNLPYEELVVDAYATGHFRALWRAPIGLAEAIPFGPMGEQSRSIVRILKDPSQTKFYVAMIPEELPVSEGLELAVDIGKEMAQTPQLILNRWLESPLPLETVNKFEGQPFADYLSSLMTKQADLKAKLEKSGMPLQVLPWLFNESPTDQIRSLAAKLGAP